MKILKGNENHFEACVSIARELPQYFTEKGIASINKDLRKHLLYVAMEQEQALGFATIHLKNNLVAEISWMAVKPKRIRQGAGSALIDYIVAELKSRGIKLLEVKTLSEDVEYPPYELTRQFYKKMGFLHIETIDPYPEWDPGNPCAIYVKIL